MRKKQKDVVVVIVGFDSIIKQKKQKQKTKTNRRLYRW